MPDIVLGVPCFIRGPISPTGTTLPTTSSIISPIQLAVGETWKKWNNFFRIISFSVLANIEGKNFKNIVVEGTEIYAKNNVSFPAKHKDIVTECTTGYVIDSPNCIYRLSLICGTLNGTTSVYVVDPSTPADISAGAKCCQGA